MHFTDEFIDEPDYDPGVLAGFSGVLFAVLASVPFWLAVAWVIWR